MSGRQLKLGPTHEIAVGRNALENFPIRCQGVQYVGRQSLADLSARQRTLWEGASWRSQDDRLRLEGSRLKRPFAIGRVAAKATVCDWEGIADRRSSRPTRIRTPG